MPIQVAAQNGTADGSLTAQELFVKLAPCVYVLEGLDEGGKVISVASAIAVGSEKVVTNKHAINAGGSLRIRQGQKTWAAVVEKLDETADLSILRVDGLGIPETPNLRRTESLTIGERVFAIGAPQGLELSLSEGLIAGLRHRGDEQGVTLVQTTAPISKGSSGGGLFDSQGRLVGITTFYLSDAQNLNFATSSDRISVLKQQTTESTARAWAQAANEIAENAQSTAGLEAPPSDLNQLNDWADRMKPRMEVVTRERERATRAYAESLRLNPRDATVWMKLGALYSWLDKPKEMKDAFDQARRLKPDDISILTSAGEAYDHLKDHTSAIQVFRDAINLQPTNPDLWVGLADVLGPSNTKEAVQALREAEKLKPDVILWEHIGSDYQNLGQYRDAEIAFREAVQLEPRRAVAWALLSNLYGLRHDKGKFRKTIEQLREIDTASADKLVRQWR